MQVNYKFLGILLVFLLGMYYYINSYNISINNILVKEDDEKQSVINKCHNMLIEKDGKILLYNSRKEIKEGENPIEFSNLDEYKDFVELQKDNNKNCPVLFLQYTTDTQNNDLLQIKPSIFESSGGLPINKSNTLDSETEKDPEKKSEIEIEIVNKYINDNKMLDATLDSNPNSKVKFNTNMYSGFDQYNQNIGLETPLDYLYNEKTEKSRNPMDNNWGGRKYTQNAINKGEYKDREVYKYTSNVPSNFSEIIK